MFCFVTKNTFRYVYLISRGSVCQFHWHLFLFANLPILFLSLKAHLGRPGHHSSRLMSCLHYKDTIPKIQNKYSQKRNSEASVPISTFMCLWAIYIFPTVSLPTCIMLQENMWTNPGNILIPHRHMIVKIGTERPHNSFSGNTEMGFSFQCMAVTTADRGVWLVQREGTSDGGFLNTYVISHSIERTVARSYSNL